jgi:aconitate hydratase
MGILPLQFMEGESAESLGLKGDEVFDVHDLSDIMKPGQTVCVSANPVSGSGVAREFKAKLRIDTPVEVEYYRNGGILRTVLRRLAAS